MKYRALALYSFAHFWVDFSCARLLFGAVAGEGNALMAFLLYNLCAFAVQMPLGLLCDRLGGAKYFAAVGCALVALAWAFGGTAAAVVAGLGNALFHVGGGVHTLNASHRCAPLGIFVSPGAIGIYLGARAAVQAVMPWAVVCGGLVLLGGAILRWGGGTAAEPIDPRPVGGGSALVPILALFAVVVLRAMVGGLLSFPWKGELGLLLALAVAGGKAAGGFLADWLGVRKTAALSLFAAGICFFLSDFPVPGLLAVFAFNMTMPLTLWGAARIFHGAKGFAFGLLTFALFLGSLPLLLGMPMAAGNGGLYAIGAIGSVLLLQLGLREGEGTT